MRAGLTFRHETLTIADLLRRYEDGRLNLSPTFQRRAVWKDRDRQLLIQSILCGFPIPAIFLYQRQDAGRLSYDVIDGKQRLESIFRFLGALRPTFNVKAEVMGLNGVQVINSRSLKGKRDHANQIRPRLDGYRISVIEVDGDLSDIVELFVRINSTGKPLTSQERRSARYSGSDLLVAATALANKAEAKFDQLGVFSAAQRSRMKHVEFCAELILSIQQGDVLNKKAAVDRVMAASTIPVSQLRKSVAEAQAAINRVAVMFPRLKATRFHQVVDFYSLVVLFAKLHKEGAILIDKKRNRIAADLLSAFGVEVDRVREQQRKVEGTSDAQATYREYLLTVSQMTDALSERKRRENILRSLLGSVFAKRDPQRGFTPEQRRLLWNVSHDQQCKECGTKLSWENFSVDHVDPHSRGGRSTLDNAALVCTSCNSSKGNRRKAKGAAPRRNAHRKGQVRVVA